MADAVEAINLTKRYKDVTALNSMNFTIPEWCRLRRDWAKWCRKVYIYAYSLRSCAPN